MAISDTAVTIDPAVAHFLGDARPMLIDGKWVAAASGKTFPVYNPATGEVMAQVAEGDTEDIQRAVTAARKAFDSGPWRTMTPSLARAADHQTRGTPGGPQRGVCPTRIPG